MATNKSLNYLVNQNMLPTTAEDILDEGNFFIGTVFDISNEVKNINRPTNNTIAEETSTYLSVALNTNWTNFRCKVDSGFQVNVIAENQIKTLETIPRIAKLTTTPSLYNGSNIPVKGQCTVV